MDQSGGSLPESGEFLREGFGMARIWSHAVERAAGYFCLTEVVVMIEVLMRVCEKKWA